MKIQEKLDDIYKDYEHNVTRIWERSELLLACDLAYHSALQFEFMGAMLTRGWVEVLIIGDTRCGKTKTAERLLRHYRAGEMGTGENTSIAGLIGGMQQISKQWSITWGKLPRNDRRLVIIDEASNIPTQSISQFATIRSEGIARITKIQTEQTFARTRAIWISNPRVNRDGLSRPISAYDYGVLTIPELIGRQADIARFDLACIVANGEVSESVIFRPERNGVPCTYKSESAHNLVMWAWSRKANDINIGKETQAEIIHQARGLAKKYHDTIPLVKLEEQPEKLARLATALAIRLFSSPDGVSVVVLPDHAAYIADFLDRCYSKPSMGYDEYSRKLFEGETLGNEPEICSRVTEYGPEFITGMLSFSIIRQNIIEDLTGLDRDRVRAFMSFLVRNRALRPEQVWYRKTQPFIKLLKAIESGKIRVTKEEDF